MTALAQENQISDISLPAVAPVVNMMCLAEPRCTTAADAAPITGHERPPLPGTSTPLAASQSERHEGALPSRSLPRSPRPS